MVSLRSLGRVSRDAGRLWGADVARGLLLLPLALLLLTLAYQVPRAAAFDFDQHWRSFSLIGFSGREYFPETNTPFRWSRAEAALGLPNPGRGALALRLILAAGPRGQVPLRLSLGPTALPPFLVTSSPRLYRIVLPQRQHSQHLTLALSAPPAADQAADRTLGVALGPVALATLPPQHPTLPLTLALACAGLGCYSLLRQATLRPALALGATLGAQAMFALAQALFLWRWELSQQVLLALGLSALAAVLVERLLLPRHTAPQQAALADSRTAGELGARRAAVISGVLALGVLLTRLPFLGLADPSGDINVMGDRATLLAEAGLGSAYYRGNDYLALRHYLLLGIGTLAELLGLSLRQPRSYAASALLKAPQLLADLLLVAMVFLAALRWRQPRGALVLALLYALTPAIWMNASWWGQVDAILNLGMLSALLLLGRRVVMAWLAWALALQVKAQPVLLAPMMAAATLRLHRARGLALGGTVLLAALALGSLPLALAGQTAGLLGAYGGAVGRYPFTSVSAYNLWSLVHGVRLVRDGPPLVLGLSALLIGLGLLALVAVAVMAVLLRRAALELRLEAGAVLALAFFTLTTQMHQRYIVFVYPFLILAAAASPRLLWPYLALLVTGTLNIFGTLPFLPALEAWIAVSWLPTLCALAHLALLLYLLYRFCRRPVA
jgi:Gpi18-like mannosyltransferase